MKRPRYADVYNAAFQSRSVVTYVRKAIKRFRQTPQHLVSVPKYVETMLRTQTIAMKNVEQSRDMLKWALALSRFIERRSARIITSQMLHYLYHPNGPWLRNHIRENRGRAFLCP